MISHKRMTPPSILGVILSIFLIFPSGAAAQDTAVEDRLEITPMLGGAFLIGQVAETDGQRFSLENAFGGGVSVSLILTRRIALDGFVSLHPTETTTTAEFLNVGFDTDLYIYGGGLRYYLTTGRGGIVPYVAGGFGEKRYEGDFAQAESDFMWNFGGGLDLSTGWIADVRFDLRNYMSSFDTVQEGQNPFLQNDIVLNVGLVFGIF